MKRDDGSVVSEPVLKESVLDLTDLQVLEDWEKAFVRHLMEGETANKAGQLVMAEFPEKKLPLSPRTSQRWAKKPHIQLALQKAKELMHQTTTLVTEYQLERVQSVIPAVTTAALANMEECLVGVKEGIKEMRDIFKQPKLSPGLKIGALGQLTKTLETMVKLSGVMQTEKTLHGQERQTTEQGMSDMLYQQIMGNVLVDVDVESEETAAPASDEAHSDPDDVKL